MVPPSDAASPEPLYTMYLVPTTTTRLKPEAMEWTIGQNVQALTLCGVLSLCCTRDLWQKLLTAVLLVMIICFIPDNQNTDEYQKVQRYGISQLLQCRIGLVNFHRCATARNKMVKVCCRSYRTE